MEIDLLFGLLPAACCLSHTRSSNCPKLHSISAYLPYPK
jgi:hypothetical protein